MAAIREKPLAARSWLAALALVAGCGDTAGESIEFAAAVRAVVAPSSGESPGAFVNAKGWAIELERADVVLGPIYLHGGGRRAQAWLPNLIPVAYAHPADATFDQGPPLGDILDQHLVDLTGSQPRSLGTVYGLKGQLATLEVQLHPPGASTAGSPEAELAAMGGASFVLEGSARKGEQTVHFAARGNLSDVASERVVGSIDADVALRDAADRPGRLVIEVHVDEWFRQVDLDGEHELDDQGRVRFPLGSRAGNALRWGVGSRFAYSARWSES